MANLGDKVVTLPSKGLLYEGAVPEGKVGIRKMTAEEAAKLLSAGSADEKIGQILRTTCKLPNAFDHKKLTSGDRLYLLIAERSLTFGAQYAITFKCPFCGQLNARHTVDLAEDLNEQKASDDLVEPVDILLPDCEKTVSLRFMRGYDEEALIKYAKRSASSGSDNDDPAYLHRLARLIVKIEGNADYDVVQREDFVGKLTASDALVIDNELDAREPGIDLTIYPECRKCGTPNEMKLPMGPEFFRPTSLRS